MKSIILLAAVLSFSAHSEIIQGIQWEDTLGQVKQRYPNALFQSAKPAWLQQDQAFFVISGSGMSGTLRILFDDVRPLLIKDLKENENNPDYQFRDTFKRLSVALDNDALTVNWVRWTPDKPIPIDRYKQRYGNPVCSFDDSMNPICKWLSVSLEAQMSDDQKLVMFVTTTFTKEEKQASSKAKYGALPPYLK